VSRRALKKLTAQVEGIVEMQARIGAALGTLTARFPRRVRGEFVGDTQADEMRLFQGWKRRVADLPPDDGALKDRTSRMELIEELHASVSARYPLGIAECLYEVITSLHIGEDEEAIKVLEYLVDGERRSIELNPEDGDRVQAEAST
jgi:hypothetical protein